MNSWEVKESVDTNELRNSPGSLKFLLVDQLVAIKVWLTILVWTFKLLAESLITRSVYLRSWQSNSRILLEHHLNSG